MDARSALDFMYELLPLLGVKVPYLLDHLIAARYIGTAVFTKPGSPTTLFHTGTVVALMARCYRSILLHV